MKRPRHVQECGMQRCKRNTLLFLSILLLVFTLLGGCNRKQTDGARKVGEVGSGEAGSGNNGGREDGKKNNGGSGEGQAGGSAGNTSNTNPGQSSSGVPADSGGKKVSAPALFHVGDVLEDGDLRIVYMACGEYREESEYLQPAAGQKYIFLEFSFENRSSAREQSLSLFSFQCYADGFAAQGYYGGSKDLAASLPAGRRTTGCLYFSVPEKAEEIDVEYQPDSLAEEKIRFLYEGDKDSGYIPEADPARTPGAFAVGDIAETDCQRISFLSCEEDDSDNTFVQPAEGCTYYTLSFEIENLEDSGGEDQETGVYDFHCYADGADCSSTLFRDDYLSAVISPGRRAKGTVTFEIPDAAQTVEAEYHPGYGRTDRLVFTVR